MSVMTQAKYTPAPPVPLEHRSWPDRSITRAPAWCSVDLRDGNQALQTPMDGETKLRLFGELVRIGFTEIEVGFPSANDTEFSFVRRLIEEDRIPEGVTIQVLTAARGELIARTFAACAGARRVIVHFYNSTNPAQREWVFGMDPDGVLALAEAGAEKVAEQAAKYPETEWVFQYSPESFSATEPEFAVRVVNRVLAVWRPTPERKAIINLPATVEVAAPNRFADQVEWMHRHMERRDAVVLSVHTHNDRGCAVAAAELALMAGAERVEGTLFGNGERTGNTDLVTVALNMLTQGVDPGLDFSDITRVQQVAEACTGMAVPPRQPYAGELVFTAFSGSHQDAIHKGLARQEDGEVWRVPYLPIDPADLGRAYEPLIRINGQSGKGGVGYTLSRSAGLTPPKGMLADFAPRIKAAADRSGTEMAPEDVVAAFRESYLNRAVPWRLGGESEETESAGKVRVSAVVTRDGRAVPVPVTGTGTGPLAAFVAGMSKVLAAPLTVTGYAEHAAGPGAGAEAVAYVALRVNGGPPCWGAGSDPSIMRAAFAAVVSAINREETGG